MNGNRPPLEKRGIFRVFPKIRQTNPRRLSDSCRYFTSPFDKGGIAPVGAQGS